MSKPIVKYISIKSLYQMNPTQFVFDMLKRIEARNKIQVKKNNAGQDVVFYGVTERENQIIELFKSGNLNPRAFGTKNEEIERVVKEGLNLPKKIYYDLSDAEIGDILFCYQGSCGIYTANKEYKIIDKRPDMVAVKHDSNDGGKSWITIDGSHKWPGNHSSEDYFKLIKQSLHEGLNLQKKIVTLNDAEVGDSLYCYHYKPPPDIAPSFTVGKKYEILRVTDDVAGWKWILVVDNEGIKHKITTSGNKSWTGHYSSFDFFQLIKKPLNEGLNLVKKSVPLKNIPKGTNFDVINHFFERNINPKITNWGIKNLKIIHYPSGWGLMNYQTLLAWKTPAGNYCINNQKYSHSTSKIQSIIRQMAGKVTHGAVQYVSEEEIYNVAGIPNQTRDYPWEGRDKVWEIVQNVMSKTIIKEEQKTKIKQVLQNEYHDK